MAVQAAHAILAGVWLGGVLFTTLVVSPALTAIKWPETQRVLVRSVIGRHYARLAVANLALLALFALLDGWASGFGAPFYMEYFLLAALFGLVALHGAYFGPRLTGLARAEQKAEAQEEARSFAEKRRTLGRLSARLSWVIRNPGDYFAAAVVRESGGRGSEKTKRQIHYPLLPKRAKRLPTPPTL